MQSPNDFSTQALVEKFSRRATRTDIAIGLLALAPFVSLMWLAFHGDRFSWGLLGKVATLYMWTMAFCFWLVIRKVQSPQFRLTACIFASGVFGSCLVLSAVSLPPQMAIAVPPIATYWITKFRARGYSQIEMMKKAMESSTGKLLV
ncbi:TPA: hypothetical protein L6A81_12155 [Pseudomonas aeruginosa]|nr:hypothetical protein [Pseudomonas aeruginosa]